MSTKHTPGPWTLVVTTPENNPNRIAAWGKVERPHSASIETNLADARLIASAPALLAALEDLVELADGAMRQANNDGGEYDRDECLKDARAALTAATGTQPS